MMKLNQFLPRMRGQKIAVLYLFFGIGVISLSLAFPSIWRQILLGMILVPFLIPFFRWSVGQAKAVLNASGRWIGRGRWRRGGDNGGAFARLRPKPPVKTGSDAKTYEEALEVRHY